MEVSSKHQHQAFSIQLQLEELVSTSAGDSYQPIGEPVKTASLHVQSRISKRRRSVSGTSGNDSAGKPKKRFRPGETDDCTFVDITALLVLPQKEAASKLGISESMLCKRFKECTRRKWPYRYLRKIDKMIRGMTLNKDASALSSEDRSKIERLTQERKQCLEPVKIRITGKDESGLGSAAPGLASSQESCGTSSDLDEEFSNDEAEEGETNLCDSLDDSDDEELAAVSTLHLLRQACLGGNLRISGGGI